uniref:Uncharacterized protein n=1 Tax=Candidatus Kentrum sp. TC TaxID=2126339 RepID=A0A450Z8W4_9GAMM|nr:MAG: hypothetical protein BECKTC1821D_GA0114238_109411 [Candidatus Kentron sp. TC]
MLLGIQSRNVNGGHKSLAFLTSVGIGAANLAVLKLVPGETTVIDIVAYLLGGPLGIVVSILIHPWLVRISHGFFYSKKEQYLEHIKENLENGWIEYDGHRWWTGLEFRVNLFMHIMTTLDDDETGVYLTTRDMEVVYLTNQQTRELGDLIRLRVNDAHVEAREELTLPWKKLEAGKDGN